jgi:hypothetical protein
MKSAALFFLAFLSLTLQASAPAIHKFYLSNTTIEFNAQNQAIEITSKIFTDDLEHAIEAQCYRYHSLNPQTPEVFELVRRKLYCERGEWGTDISNPEDYIASSVDFRELWKYMFFGK